jgi:hypothetical protein
MITSALILSPVGCNAVSKGASSKLAQMFGQRPVRSRFVPEFGAAVEHRFETCAILRA